MTYTKAKNLDEALTLMGSYSEPILICGSTDIALQLKKKKNESHLIDISALDELAYIKKNTHAIEIGALSTINDILYNQDIQTHLPLLNAVSNLFASHQIRNLATIGGNIANASPVADLIAPLIVLNATLTLSSKEGQRVIKLEDLFCGYKCTKLNHEIIHSIHIPIQEHLWYYRKVGSRERLSISKVSLAIIKTDDTYYISGASLNPYSSRFRHLEALLNQNICSDNAIKEALEKDIHPSGSLRSTKEYRKHVTFNMIKEALVKFNAS
ncbi:MAG: FAD binding domain-containing protein [Campylobacterota bacterium]|nr:FAD binding domain-containing protein [Campylobacterota bacterium]